MNLKELHPELSYRQIGSKIGKSQTFASKWIRLARLHNSVADQPRSGRPHKLNAKAVQHILAAAKQKQCKSAAAITARVQQKSVLKVSVSTVQRALRREGLKHLRPKVVPMLTAKQRHTRTRFGTAAQRTDTVCWLDTMITDSSIFRMHPMGKPAGSWCTQATRGTVGRHGMTSTISPLGTPMNTATASRPVYQCMPDFASCAALLCAIGMVLHVAKHGQGAIPKFAC